MSEASNKRDELQWLRALAIFAVLSFHLCPGVIPYGYLGVDIFFVLSGYLMAVILSKNESIILFYSCRIKRIFPTFLFITMIFLICCYFFLLPSHFDFLKTETLWSIFFVNNFASIFHQKQYFELLSDFQFFLHTWSLGVEIQFYLVAPFLIRFLLLRKNPMYWILIFTVLSWLLQTFIPNENISFGFIFCRIWQFLIGVLTYSLTVRLCSDNIKSSKMNINLKTSVKGHLISLLLLFLICFLPISIDNYFYLAPVLRLLSSLATGAFIGLITMEQLRFPRLFSSVLVYVGNASFVIYLIHWPLIVFFKYLDINYGICFTLFCIFSSSILIHECFEKPMIKLSCFCNALAIIMFYFIIIYIVFSKHQNVTLQESNTIMDPVKANELEYESCKSMYYDSSCIRSPLLEKYLTIRPTPVTEWDKYCYFKLNSNGNNTALIVGNSFTFFHMRGILDAIKQSKIKFSEAYVITYPGWSEIAGDNIDRLSERMQNIKKGSHDKFLEIVKPDVIVHSSKLAQFLPSLDMPFAFDKYYFEFEKSLQHLSKYTRRLILIEPHPIDASKNYTNPLTVAQILNQKRSVDHFKIAVKEHHKRSDASWLRLKEAAKKCSKCAIIATKKLFCTSSFCSMVDPVTKITKYCDFSHLTPKTSKILTPLLVEEIDKID